MHGENIYIFIIINYNFQLRVSGSKSEADFKQAMKKEATVAENDDSSVKKSEKDGEK